MELLKEILEQNKYFRSTEKMKMELDNEDIEIKYNRIIKIAEKAGKGWLAMDLIEYVQKENKSIIVPEYIMNALIHVFNDKIYDNCISKILKTYSKANDIEFQDLLEKRTDKIDTFIDSLIERCKEKNDNDITETV